MRILITGGAGFLGSHLSDLLLQSGHSVICMDNLLTGRVENIAHLLGHERFSLSNTMCVTICILKVHWMRSCTSHHPRAHKTTLNFLLPR